MWAHTRKATKMGTLAADCIGVALSGTTARIVESGFVGRYRSSRGTFNCANNPKVMFFTCVNIRHKCVNILNIVDIFFHRSSCGTFNCATNLKAIKHV